MSLEELSIANRNLIALRPSNVALGVREAMYYRPLGTQIGNDMANKSSNSTSTVSNVYKIANITLPSVKNAEDFVSVMTTQGSRVMTGR